MADRTVEVSSNAAAVAVRYEKAPKLIAKNVVQIFRRIGAGLQAAVVRDKLSSRVGQQALGRRTGNLARAIYYKITLDTNAKDVVLVLGADRKKAAYAAAQEYGATIVPRKSKFLTMFRFGRLSSSTDGRRGLQGRRKRRRSVLFIT